MDWLNLHIPSTIRSPEYIGSSPAERGTWLSVISYACAIECGGVLVGASEWKDRQWQQACGVTLREVKASSRLLRFVGDDVHVNGYPRIREEKVRTNRINASAGAMARWGKNGTSESMPHGTADLMPSASDMLMRKEKGKEKEKGKGVGTPDGDGFADSLSTPTGVPAFVTVLSDMERWPFVSKELWAGKLAALVGNKIGRTNWRAWERLVQKFGLDRVHAAADALLPESRWPNNTETALLTETPAGDQSPSTRPLSDSDQVDLIIATHGWGYARAFMAEPKRARDERSLIELAYDDPAVAREIIDGHAKAQRAKAKA